MDVHDSMLFRWVGHDIEQPDERGWSAPRRTELRSNARLDQQRTDTYLGFLRAALNPNCGLRVSDFSDADLVGKGNPLGRRAPCLFLTEQSASDPDEHWRLYGRLGFGFSKRFIFERGGRPVVYAGGRSDAVIQAVSYLRKRLSDKFTNPDHHSSQQSSASVCLGLRANSGGDDAGRWPTRATCLGPGAEEAVVSAKL